jgi:hypothetical protein
MDVSPGPVASVKGAMGGTPGPPKHRPTIRWFNVATPCANILHQRRADRSLTSGCSVPSTTTAGTGPDLTTWPNAIRGTLGSPRCVDVAGCGGPDVHDSGTAAFMPGRRVTHHSGTWSESVRSSARRPAGTTRHRSIDAMLVGLRRQILHTRVFGSAFDGCDVSTNMRLARGGRGSDRPDAHRSAIRPSASG